MMKRLCALMTALVLALSMAAALADETEEDTLLVTVNGKEIRENDPLLTFLVSYYTQYGASGGYDMQAEENIQAVRQSTMEQTVLYTLIGQEMDKLGVSVTDEDLAPFDAQIEEEWENTVKSVMASVFGIGDDAPEEDKIAARADALAYIQENAGHTKESYAAQIHAYGWMMRVSELFSEEVSKGVEITDQDVETYYNGLVEEGRGLVGDDPAAYEFYSYYGYDLKYIPAGFRGIKHILLEADQELLNTMNNLAEKLEAQNDPGTEGTEDAENTETEGLVTQEMVDAAKQAVLDSVQETVDEIMAKLEAGASFEDLIAEYGKDPGMLEEPYQANGYPVYAESVIYDPAFQKAAMELEKAGDVSGPVVSSFGVHILQYLKDIPEGAIELTDAMKEEIRESLRTDTINTVAQEWITKATDEADIVWTEAGGAWKPAEETASEETAETAGEAATEETAPDGTIVK